MSLTIIVKRPSIRSAVLRDAQGRSTRVVLGGANAWEAEREMIRAAEIDGVDLRTSQMERSSMDGLGRRYIERDPKPNIK